MNLFLLFALLSIKTFSTDINQFEIYLQVSSITTIDSTQYEEDYVSRISRVDFYNSNSSDFKYCQITLFKEGISPSGKVSFGKPWFLPEIDQFYYFKIIESNNVCIINEYTKCRDIKNVKYRYSCPEK